MNPKYRMLIDRSGEAIERIEPGGTFGWTRLEWCQFGNPGSQRHGSGPAPQSDGSMSIGLPMGPAYQYLTQAMLGQSPLAGIVIEVTTSDGRRTQVNLRDASVDNVAVHRGEATIQLAFKSIKGH